MKIKTAKNKSNYLLFIFLNPKAKLNENAKG